MGFRSATEIRAVLDDPDRVQTRKVTSCAFCNEEGLAWDRTPKGKPWLYNVAKAVDLSEEEQEDLRHMPNFEDPEHGFVYVLKFEPHPRCREQAEQEQAEDQATLELEADDPQPENNTNGDDYSTADGHIIIEEDVLQMMTEEQVAAQQNSTSNPSKPRRRGSKAKG